MLIELGDSGAMVEQGEMGGEGEGCWQNQDHQE